MITKPSSSIKTQLIRRIFFPILLLFVVVGGVALFSADDEIGEVTDAQLAHSAKILLQLAEYEANRHSLEKVELGTEQPKLIHSYEDNLIFRLWKEDHLILQSNGSERFKDLDVSTGFSDQTIAGDLWRFLVFLDQASGIKVEIAEKNTVRDELVTNILVGFLIPLSIFIPLLLFIVWLAIHKGFNRLVTISQTVDQRESNDFTEIDLGGVPQEIQPLIKALNRLFQRIENSFDRERAFTDNAAHELRTPLAAMKTQTQVLLLKLENQPEYRESLDNLHATIDRAAHMVEQLLSFSRLQTVNTKFEIVNFSEITEETLRYITPSALEKGVNIEADLVPDVKLRGDANAFAVMIRNLVHNAIKYTPEHGHINLSLGVEDQQVILRVTDTGPGIKGDKKERVFERFYRINKNDGIGSGLGLSMVKWVCDVHGAKIVLADNTPTGLVVIVTFVALKD